MSRNILHLQPGIIYGPINSRRLGSSLGLNILPPSLKACPFNCAYCQYGYTRPPGFTSDPSVLDFPSVGEIDAALRGALDEYPSVSYITFSGNGEPTLHPRFNEIVDRVKLIKEQMAPSARLAILSNSAFVDREHVREALKKLDDRFMKLDAGDEKIFRKFNRPHKDINFENIVSGLKQLGNIVIQALFAGGEKGNTSAGATDDWIEKISEIRPIECHIYSLDRPTADEKLQFVSRDELDIIKSKAEAAARIRVKVF